MDYTRISGSKFPNGIIDLPMYADVDSEHLSLIKTVKGFQANNDYDSMNAYLDTYPELKKYMFGADTINRIVEELRNVQIYSRSTQQQVFYQDISPTDAVVNDVWIGA